MSRNVMVKYNNITDPSSLLPISLDHVGLARAPLTSNKRRRTSGGGSNYRRHRSQDSGIPLQLRTLGFLRWQFHLGGAFHLDGRAGPRSETAWTQNSTYKLSYHGNAAFSYLSIF